MSYYIIGTAGHVDHGNTELIRALTGESTDRLKEEQARGISIELGFASLMLPNGSLAGIVDVPGHERFVRQMLAGIGGIDLVLLVIAADEGVMPQTKEHLEIIDLLQVRKGIIVLNKTDLVDADWLELVMLEVKESLSGTVLQDAPIVAVSALKGVGIHNLVTAIEQELDGLPPREYYGPCRIPIDRTFSISGFGTIVTGTMYQGSVQVGDNVVIEPGHQESRVRSLQVHGEKVEKAYAGQRVAVNLPNLEVNTVIRGSTLLTPGFLTPVQTLDVSLKYLASAAKPLAHRQRVRVHIGTQETMGRVHLLDREEAEPGQMLYAQILMEELVIADRGDRFVIRQYSPARTIGGGTVIDGGKRKYKRHASQVLEMLAIKAKGSPRDILDAFLQNVDIPLSTNELLKSVGLSSDELEAALKDLTGSLDVVQVEQQNYWFKKLSSESWTARIETFLQDYHRKYYLRPGVPKEELKSRFFLKWNNKLFTAFLEYMESIGRVVNKGSFVAAPDFVAGPKGDLATVVPLILQEYRVAELSPPEWTRVMNSYNIDGPVGIELLQFFLREAQLTKVSEILYFSSDALRSAMEQLQHLLSEKSEFTAMDAKEKLGISRKYLIPILEYMDSQKITRRIGDKRTRFK